MENSPRHPAADAPYVTAEIVDAPPSGQPPFAGAIDAEVIGGDAPAGNALAPYAGSAEPGHNEAIVVSDVTVTEPSSAAAGPVAGTRQATAEMRAERHEAVTPPTAEELRARYSSASPAVNPTVSPYQGPHAAAVTPLSSAQLREEARKPWETAPTPPPATAAGIGNTALRGGSGSRAVPVPGGVRMEIDTI